MDLGVHTFYVPPHQKLGHLIYPPPSFPTPRKKWDLINLSSSSDSPLTWYLLTSWQPAWQPSSFDLCLPHGALRTNRQTHPSCAWKGYLISAWLLQAMWLLQIGNTRQCNTYPLSSSGVITPPKTGSEDVIPTPSVIDHQLHPGLTDKFERFSLFAL